jgi:glycosyltransferase involved in cell wall biosynthesis
MGAPLISCLTPTYNRRGFFPRAVKCFLSQDYPNLEWVILDDGTDSIKDLLPDDPRIKYFQESPKQPHSVKMNRCFELSSGVLGIVWDDDDWYAPDRVSKQTERLVADPEMNVAGLSEFYYYVHGTQVAYHYKSNQVPWIGAIAVRRSIWTKYRFDADPKPGADNRLLQKIPQPTWVRVSEPRLLVATIHTTNDCKKAITSSYVSEPWSTIQGLLGEDV